jgi:RNA polymerase sigma-70 factor (ECF subfamily)
VGDSGITSETRVDNESVTGATESAAIEVAVLPKVERSFRDGVQAIYPAVWRCLRRFGVPEQDLDDALQTVLFQLHAKWSQLATFDESRLRSYACCASVGVARTAAKRRQRDGRRSLPLDEERTRGHEDPARTMESREELEQLDAALESLESSDREVFVLYEIEGFTGAEIAEHLGVPRGTVASRLRRGREDFKRAVRAQDPSSVRSQR